MNDNKLGNKDDDFSNKILRAFFTDMETLIGFCIEYGAEELNLTKEESLAVINNSIVTKLIKESVETNDDKYGLLSESPMGLRIDIFGCYTFQNFAKDYDNSLDIIYATLKEKGFTITIDSNSKKKIDCDFKDLFLHHHLVEYFLEKTFISLGIESSKEEYEVLARDIYGILIKQYIEKQ